MMFEGYDDDDDDDNDDDDDHNNDDDIDALKVDVSADNHKPLTHVMSVVIAPQPLPYLSTFVPNWILASCVT